MISSTSEAPERTSRPQVIAAWVLAALLLIFSGVMRFYNLHSPLLERHEFRQCQTALTTWTFLNEGISFFPYQTPVFGPPWTLPFEFPIFQAAAALLIKVTGLDIDTGSRLTSILFFYASAFILCLITHHCVRSLSTTVCVAICYCCMPLSIVWSRTSMIEYAAVFFCLLYLYALLRFYMSAGRGSPTIRIMWALVALIAGMLAFLTKITSLAAVAPALFAFSLWHYLKSGRTFLAEDERGKRVKILLVDFVTPVLLALIPFLVGHAWVAYTDRVKETSTFTGWLTSKALGNWNYGTLDQRLTSGIWMEIVPRITQYVLPYAALFLPAAAFLFSRSTPSATRILIYASAAGCVLPILCFFNLYWRHDYYLAAITPVAALLAGVGLYNIFRCFSSPAARLAILILLGLSLALAFPYVRPSMVTDYKHPTVILGDAIAQASSPGDYVLITDRDWNPDALYYAKRKGLMYRTAGASGYDNFPTKGFTVVVTNNENHPLLNNWSHRRTVAKILNSYVIQVKNPTR